MPRPGTDILISEPSPGGGGELDTGQAFMVGVAQRGPVDRPASVGSLSLWERRFGPRAGGPVAHNSVRAFFTERGSNLQFLRLAGDSASAAQAEVADLQVSAGSPGTWGNNVQVSIVADVSPLLAKTAAPKTRKTTRDDENGNENGTGNGDPAGPVRVVVTEGGQVVERSRQVRTVGEALSWARTGSDYLSLEADADDEEKPLTPTAATDLTGGTDDNNITAEVVSKTLNRFPYTMGFAQVLYPGATDSDVHAAILAHCDRNRRPALLDLNDQDDATIASDANALHGVPGSRFAAVLAPRIIYPGPVSGTTMLIPYSAVQAGIIARADATTNNPNEAAAGSNGESLVARGYAREFDNDTRELLNDLGVTLPRMMRSGVMRTYGTRTVAGPDDTNWMWFPGSRTVLAMAHEFDNAAEEFVHRQIDGQRRLFTRLEVALGGICLEWFGLGALYGDEPEEAFSIDTQSVNTTETIAAGEVHAIVRLRTSPPGEWVVIEIQKTPITQSV
jgi:phage tail sheath protein FI